MMPFGAGKTTATQAAAHAGVTLPLKSNPQELKIIAPPPVTVGGCTLPSPPVVVTIGPFEFNILDWQKAAKAQKKEMVFRGTITPAVATYLSNVYADTSKRNFQRAVQYLRLAASSAMGTSAIAAIQLPSYATGPLAQIISGTNVLKMNNHSYSKEYKGWSSNWDFPYRGKDKLEFLRSLSTEMYWISRDVLDGKAPIAKVDPPFGDSGHKWGLFVEWTDRKIGGKDEVVVTLKQLSQSWVEKLEYEVASVLSVGLNLLCSVLTHEKLQDVRNFAAAYPNPTVQSSMLAWQGVAQACGTSVPAQPTGAPSCIPTEPPGMTMSWWDKYKNWVIAGGLAVLGLGGVAYYHSRSRP